MHHNLVLSKEFLTQEFIQLKKTKARIARENNCDVQTVNLYLKKYGLYFGRSKDLSNLKFDKLQPLYVIGCDNHHKVQWLCKCDCGKEVIINASSLLRNLTTSCGCFKIEKCRQGYKDISKSYWRRKKQDAYKRGYEFSITQEYVWTIYEQQNRKCIFSGIDVLFYYDNNRPQLQTASIDRINCNIGYIEGNIQIVHKTVNLMKSFLNDDEFIAWCNLIAINRGMSNEDCQKNINRQVLRKI